jgi:hypothetical protein
LKSQLYTSPDELHLQNSI